MSSPTAILSCGFRQIKAGRASHGEKLKRTTNFLPPVNRTP
jgi:hypothetical protein